MKILNNGKMNVFNEKETLNLLMQAARAKDKLPPGDWAGFETCFSWNTETGEFMMTIEGKTEAEAGADAFLKMLLDVVTSEVGNEKRWTRGYAAV